MHTHPPFFAKSQPAWDMAVLNLDAIIEACPELAKATRIHFWSGDEPECPLLKASDIPAGAHWITAHPHGPGTKGVPILVQETKKGSGTFHVIGGAGGKLNYLKLTGVKSPEHYAAEAGDRAKSRREEAKAQAAKDKELGIDGDKKAARAALSADRAKHEQEFVRHVADAMGWDQSHLDFDEDAHAGLSDAAREKARGKHARDLLKRAKEAVTLQRKRLLVDADARRQAFTGEMPLHVDDATVLSVADLNPVKPNNGMGFDPAYKERAEAAGLTKDAAAAEAAGVLDVGVEDPPEVLEAKKAAKVEKAKERADVAAKLAEELASVNADAPNLPARIVDVQQAVALLKADKKLKMIQAAARGQSHLLERSVEPKALPLAVSETSAADIEAEVVDKLRTAQTVGFLEAVKENGAEQLEHHVAAGAFNAINSLSQIAGGTSMMDRSVVDVLGPQAAAVVLARRLRTSLGDARADEIAEGLGNFHLSHSDAVSQETLAHVAELHEQAAQLEIDANGTADDLLLKSELNKKRVDALGDAQKALGRALGEMEGNAALVFALGDKVRDKVQVSLGKTAPAQAIAQLRAIGLQEGDYLMEKSAAGSFVTINADGMDRLASTADGENAARVQRNLAIMNGAEDEADWLPEGFANRADLALDLQPGVAPSLAQPFSPGADLSASLKDYIGARTADGDSAGDILSDIQSAAFFEKVGPSRAAEYRAALDAVAPNKNASGKQMQRAEELEPAFNQYADDHVAAKYGGTRSTLNRQTFEADEVAQDALHRALSAEPAGVAAYKPIGDMTDGDRRALREHFYKHIAKESPEHASLRAALDKHLDDEPTKTETDMFGEEAVNPNWTAWNAAKTELQDKVKASGLGWPDYAKTMRGHENAYAALQDIVRSKVSSEFATHYNRLNPAKPIKTGKTVIRGNLNHLDAVDPEARQARMAAERQLIDSLRERVNGRYTSGSVAGKLEAAKEQKAAFEQAQMGFFSADELAPPDDGKPAPLGADERHTIGHAAEAKIAAMMGKVGANFVPGQPVKLFHASMSGPDGVKRQRAIKMMLANKRVVYGLGVGSGKTGIGLGSFAHLHSTGKVKKGIFAVPSIVQGQFGSEALRFLKPGQFNFHCQPGASFEERLAAYKDPSTHFAVVTHQSLRDDILKIAGMHHGGTPEQVAEKMAGMGQKERAAFVKDAFAAHGIHFDFAMADEGHGLLNREGKDNSRMSNAVQAVTDNAEYYAHASGDPVKNDASEAFDLLAKMDAGRYNDRAAFMRKYGADTVYAKEGLRREMARHAYTASLSPDVNVTRHEVVSDLSPAQKASLDALDRHVAAARIAKLQGGVDVNALRALSPRSFEGVDPGEHEAVAKQLTKALGVIHESAVKRVISAHPEAAKLKDLEATADKHRGKPGVVFARSLDAVNQIKERLERAGHSVMLITGADSSKDKSAKIKAFNPDAGERKADIVICSDAGAVGANLQNGSWLAQYDVPDTAMVHAQRAGRINRIGQRSDIDLYDLRSNHQSERRATDRLARKYALREVVTSPLDGLDDTGLASFLHHQQQEEAQASMF
jgi:hypothetical protein